MSDYAATMSDYPGRLADMTGLPVGSLVDVRPAYVGNGRYAPDGHEGLHTVVGYLKGGDYYLARGDWRHNADRAMWDVIVHEGRLTRVEVL